MFPWLLAAVLMGIVGRYSDYLTKHTRKLRISRSYPILLSQLLASLCIVPLVFLSHPNLFLVVVLISLAVALSMCANANYYAVNIDIAKQRAGTALGIMDTGFALSGFLAPVITGYLVEATGKFDAAFGLLILLGLSSVVLVWCWHHPDTQKVS